MNIIRKTTSLAVPFAFAAIFFTPAANADAYAHAGDIAANGPISHVPTVTVGIPTKLAKNGRVEDAVRCLEANGVPKAIASAAAGACLVYPLPAKVVPCFVAFGIASGMAERCGG